MIIGYARTSTIDQIAGLEDQQRILTEAGCDPVLAEHISSVEKDRPALELAIATLSAGDIFIVTRPDRLARSVRDMLEIMDRVREKGASVRILSMGVDTATPTGKLILTVLSGVAEWEREIMLERQKVGILKAKADGRYHSRPTRRKADLVKVRALMTAGLGVQAIANVLSCNRTNVWRAMNKLRETDSAAYAAEFSPSANASPVAHPEPAAAD